MDIGMWFLVFLMFLLCFMFSVAVFSQERAYKRRYEALELYDKFFLLDTWNGNKCIIEVVEKFEKDGSLYVAVMNNGNRYQYSYKQFFTEVLIHNHRFYYEKLNKDSLDNITK